MGELTTEWARANLSAGPLGSYAFRIEASLGHRPMTYLFARSFERVGAGQRATTVLLVIAPAALARTRITITETLGQLVPEVTTYLPTMRVPKLITGPYMFECLPLTDVGYVDLMAWPHPPARYTGSDPAPSWSSWRDRVPVVTGRSVAPGGVELVETVSAEHGIPLARSVVVGGTETRQWEATELGPAEQGYLPRKIRVTRPQTRHWTVFERVGKARPIPAEWLADDYDRLRDAILGELGE
jgi:hypothetical protein